MRRALVRELKHDAATGMPNTGRLKLAASKKHLPGRISPRKNISGQLNAAVEAARPKASTMLHGKHDASWQARCFMASTMLHGKHNGSTKLCTGDHRDEQLSQAIATAWESC
jgi:hypothetical protein